MSDLPTVTGFPEVTVDEWGYIDSEVITAGDIDLDLPPGTYLLVPKEQMERVWWCEAHDSPAEDGGPRAACESRRSGDNPAPCAGRQGSYIKERWLVKGNE